jgi:hypothetical protein
MGKFLITYSGGAQPEGMTEEQTTKVMQAWNDWYAGLGDAVEDLGSPAAASKVGAPEGS